MNFPENKFPTKAEILITRACNLQCSYCAMVHYMDPRKDKMSDVRWGLVPEVLSELEIPFAAIYGAEPTLRMEALCKFIKGCTEYDIATTIITNMTTITNTKLLMLKDVGLNSITMSYDGNSIKDKDIDRKSEDALNNVNKLKEYFDDIELIYTVTRENMAELPKVIREASNEGIYTSFDVVHPDRGQEGSKCKDSYATPLITPFEWKKFRNVLEILIKAKTNNNIKLHNSLNFLKYLKSNLKTSLNFQWRCEPASWITIDQDGTVFGCDDYQPEKMRNKFHILEYGLKWDWDKFVDYYRKIFNCPGCIWSTHWMASEWYQQDGKSWIKELIH